MLILIEVDRLWLYCVSLQESPMHKALFWVAVAVLQLDEVNLYSAGTALLEQNLHTLDTMRVFNDKVTCTPHHTTVLALSTNSLNLYYAATCS